MGAVAVFQFIDGGAGGFAEQLVAHADAADGLAAERDLLADDVDGSLTGVGVAGTIGQEEAVEVHRGVVVVPRHADDLDAAADEAADDIGLDAAVDEHHLLAGALVVADNLLGRDLIDEVDALIGGLGDVVGLIVEDDLTHHHTVLAQHLGQLAGVDARDAGHMLALEPVGQTLVAVPVVVLFAIVGADHGGNVNLVALHECGQAIGLNGKRRYAVVADKGEGECEDLTGIGGVGERLGVAHHGGVEHHLAGYRLIVSEAAAAEARAVG